MNAYYIGLTMGQHLDDIDIGIGTQAYWEWYVIDAVVIAECIGDALAAFSLDLSNDNMTPVTQNTSSFIQIVNTLAYESDDFLQHEIVLIAELIDDPAQIVNRKQDHWLCKVVQHHPDIDKLARYHIWRKESPNWFGVTNKTVQEKTESNSADYSNASDELELPF